MAASARLRHLANRIAKLEEHYGIDDEPVLIRFSVVNCAKGAPKVANGELHKVIGDGFNGLNWVREPSESEDAFLNRVFREGRDAKPRAQAFIGYEQPGPSFAANAPANAGV